MPSCGQETGDAPLLSTVTVPNFIKEYKAVRERFLQKETLKLKLCARKSAKRLSDPSSSASQYYFFVTWSHLGFNLRKKVQLED